MKLARWLPFLALPVCTIAAAPSMGDAGGIQPLQGGPAGPAEVARIGAAAGVILCHQPGGPTPGHTIIVGEAAVPAHVDHGDAIGCCGSSAPGVLSPVPKTGQTGCWDQAGNTIGCAGTGQDGEYQKGVGTAERFVDNGDGSVKDNMTGLIWLKNSNCFGTRLWVAALAESNALASGMCGLSDGSVAGEWRLPNVRELASLLDYGQAGSGLPAGHPFSGVAFNNYWSSTTYVFDPAGAWVVGLGGGGGGYYKTSGQYVWPVRDGS